MQQVPVPPRLLAHLLIVHDVAAKLIEKLDCAFPNLSLDRDAVRFGASVHDIGKAIILNELVEPGEEHELRGAELLRGMGVPEDRARFAYTHGRWRETEGLKLEDLLVALADKCWKGKRVEDLERKTTELLSAASGRPVWACFAELDSILELLARDADSRLAWQASLSASGQVDPYTFPRV
ncbi:MAG TPA: HD domain-containing protein [Terracidiphilus sp.]|nr:HD domain-containing protein [Terracidiphilus sp.]